MFLNRSAAASSQLTENGQNTLGQRLSNIGELSQLTESRISSSVKERVSGITVSTSEETGKRVRGTTASAAAYVSNAVKSGYVSSSVEERVRGRTSYTSSPIRTYSDVNLGGTQYRLVALKDVTDFGAALMEFPKNAAMPVGVNAKRFAALVDYTNEMAQDVSEEAKSSFDPSSLVRTVSRFVTREERRMAEGNQEQERWLDELRGGLMDYVLQLSTMPYLRRSIARMLNSQASRWNNPEVRMSFVPLQLLLVINQFKKGIYGVKTANEEVNTVAAAANEAGVKVIRVTRDELKTGWAKDARLWLPHMEGMPYYYIIPTQAPVVPTITFDNAFDDELYSKIKVDVSDEGAIVEGFAQSPFIVFADTIDENQKRDLIRAVKAIPGYERTEFYTLPSGFVTAEADGRKFRLDNQHIDTVLAFVSREFNDYGEDLLLIDPFYHDELLANENARPVLEAFIKRQNLRVIRITEDEVIYNPANFIRVLNGKLIFNYAPKTISDLKLKTNKYVMLSKESAVTVLALNGGAVGCLATSTELMGDDNEVKRELTGVNKTSKVSSSIDNESLRAASPVAGDAREAASTEFRGSSALNEGFASPLKSLVEPLNSDKLTTNKVAAELVEIRLPTSRAPATLSSSVSTEEFFKVASRVVFHGALLIAGIKITLSTAIYGSFLAAFIPGSLILAAVFFLWKDAQEKSNAEFLYFYAPAATAKQSLIIAVRRFKAQRDAALAYGELNAPVSSAKGSSLLEKLSEFFSRPAFKFAAAAVGILVVLSHDIVKVAATGAVFSVNMKYVIAAAIIGYFSPYLWKVLLNFFWSSHQKYDQEQQILRKYINGSLNADDKKAIDDLVASVEEELKDNSLSAKVSYRSQAQFGRFVMLMPALSGTVAFTLGRLQLLLFGSILGQAVYTALFGARNVGLLFGIAPLEALFNFAKLEYKTQDLFRIVFIVYMLKIFSRGFIHLRNQIQQNMLGAASTLDAQLIYNGLKGKTIESESVQPLFEKGLINFSGKPGLRAMVAAKLTSPSIDTFNNRAFSYLHYYALPAVIALGMIITSPVAGIVLLMHYVSKDLSETVLSNHPYYRLWLAKGREFYKSFFGMWIISAEIGAVVGAGEYFAGHDILKYIGGTELGEFALKLEGPEGIISWGSHAYNDISGLFGVDFAYQLYTLIGGKLSETEWNELHPGLGYSLMQRKYQKELHDIITRLLEQRQGDKLPVAVDPSSSEMPLSDTQKKTVEETARELSVNGFNGYAEETARANSEDVRRLVATLKDQALLKLYNERGMAKPIRAGPIDKLAKQKDASIPYIYSVNYNGEIILDSDFIKTATSAQIAGKIVHEISAVAGRSHDESIKAEEEFVFAVLAKTIKPVRGALKVAKKEDGFYLTEADGTRTFIRATTLQTPKGYNPPHLYGTRQDLPYSELLGLSLRTEDGRNILDVLAPAGFNAIRVPTLPNYSIEEQQKALEVFIAEASKRGIRVIVTLWAGQDMRNLEREAEIRKAKNISDDQFLSEEDEKIVYTLRNPDERNLDYIVRHEKKWIDWMAKIGPAKIIPVLGNEITYFDGNDDVDTATRIAHSEAQRINLTTVIAFRIFK
jgi:hypothetical protein